MGGSDDPSNIQLLSVEEHAKAHYRLWCKYGKLEDKTAWLMLSGIIKEGVEELRRFNHKQWYLNNRPAPRSLESITKQSLTIKGHPYRGGHRPKGYKLTSEAKERIRYSKLGKPNLAVAEANRNRKIDETTRKKLSESHKKPVIHGTIKQYWRGCRCKICKVANNTYCKLNREKE